MTVHAHTRSERFSETRWLARTDLVAYGPDSWQDVSVRPEGTPERSWCAADGFTVAIYTHDLLRKDFEEGVGPDPDTLLDPAAEATLDVPNLAVYVARPFGPAEALFYTEALMVEAGVRVASLEEVGGERFFAPFLPAVGHG